MIRSFVLAMVCMTTFTACSWVDLTAQGQAVRVVRPGDVVDCRRIGEVTAKVVDKVAFVKRSREKQARELETLARNEAGETDGNTIVAAGDIEDGRRRFTVYRCE